VNISMIHRGSILGLLGIVSSRRPGRTRIRRRPTLLGVERIEDRVVLSAIDPILAGAVSLQIATNPLPTGPLVNSGGYGDNAKYFSAHDGEICATFVLDTSNPDVAKELALHPEGIQVTLQSLALINPSNVADQSLIRQLTQSLTATLTGAKPTATLCVEVDDHLCSQVDSFVGGAPSNPLTTDNLLRGAIFHPSFDASGVETFTVEATSFPADVVAFLKTECPPAKIGSFGLTIGFWKNHHANWVDYTGATRLGSIFAELDSIPAYAGLRNLTFDDALSFSGGPGLADKAGLLLKQAVGALLNASNPDVGYPLTTGQIKAAVNDALASQNATAILTLQTQLDTMNSVDVSSITNPINDKKK